MTKISIRLQLLGLLFFFSWIAIPAQAVILVNTVNPGGVSHASPAINPTFTITDAYTNITWWNYHWNGGTANWTPSSQVGLVGVGSTAFAETWFDTYSNAYGRDWWANSTSDPILATLILQPGTYKVLDSDMPTWSRNSSSSWLGMTQISGDLYTPPPPLPTPEPATWLLMGLGLVCLRVGRKLAA